MCTPLAISAFVLTIFSAFLFVRWVFSLAGHMSLWVALLLTLVAAILAQFSLADQPSSEITVFFPAFQCSLTWLCDLWGSWAFQHLWASTNNIATAIIALGTVINASSDANTYLWITVGVAFSGFLVNCGSLVTRAFYPQGKLAPTDDNFRVTCIWKSLLFTLKLQVSVLSVSLLHSLHTLFHSLSSLTPFPRTFFTLHALHCRHSLFSLTVFT